jgi:thymidylate synthase ThyX
MGTQHNQDVERRLDPGVRLVSYNPEAVIRVVAALLFAHSNAGLEELEEYCRQLPEEEINRILDAACSARENRRHKSPRALEHAEFTFEINADFGAYRDLHRHRILTQERQLLCCDYGYYCPSEIIGTSMEAPYREALESAKEVFDAIACELPEEAQYVVPMAYNVRWYFHVNLRALQWLCELRSAPQGHASYRYIAQCLAKEVCRVFPAFERFFKYVDFEGYELGRLGQEQRKVDKQRERS